MQTRYKQCELRRGTQVDIAWIPAEFAVVGKILEVKGINGWVVKSVGGSMTQDEANQRSRDHTRQREASDI